MLPDPLHPAVVHFPIVLAALMPLIAAAALWAIARGTRPRFAWGIAVVAFAAVAASGFAATQTGEQQEDRVERVVPEQPFEAHEEAGERFSKAALIVLLLAAAGLAPGMIGKAGRIVATLGAIVLAAMIWQVGESGGALVYEHGAASAYSSPAGGGAPRGGGEEDDDDEASLGRDTAAVALAGSAAPAANPDSALQR